MIYIRSANSILLFPRASLALFLLYHFYLFSHPSGFHLLALLVLFLFLTALMIYCVRKFEFEAYHRGLVNIDQPRGMYQYRHAFKYTDRHAFNYTDALLAGKTSDIIILIISSCTTSIYHLTTPPHSPSLFLTHSRTLSVFLSHSPLFSLPSLSPFPSLPLSLFLSPALRNNLPWPTWAVALAPDYTLFMPVTIRSSTLYQNNVPPPPPGTGATPTPTPPGD